MTMRIRFSTRCKSYAVYVYDYDDDDLVKWAMRVFAKNVAWYQEIYDGSRYKKIIVVRHVG